MRDLITNDIETQVEGAKLDGMICLTSCDKTVPGHLMAAARLNIPTHPGDRRLSGPSGVYHNHHVDIEEVFLGAGHHVAGSTVVRRSARHERERHHQSPGVCSGMGTANSMHIVCEALGMSLPGGAPVLANSKRMIDFAKKSGKPHRRDGGGGSAAAHDHDAGRFRQCRRWPCSASPARSTASSICRRPRSKPACDLDFYKLFERTDRKGAGDRRGAADRRFLDRGIREPRAARSR